MLILSIYLGNVLQVKKKQKKQTKQNILTSYDITYVT